MKHFLPIALIVATTISVVAQTTTFEYQGRVTPAIKLADLDKAVNMGDIMPDFCTRVMLAYHEKIKLEKRVHLVNYPQYKSQDPAEYYHKLIELVSAEITTTSNGQKKTSSNLGENLAPALKRVLSGAAMGTEISMKVLFRYKNQPGESPHYKGELVEGLYIVAVVPEKEAQFPGGWPQFSSYLDELVFRNLDNPRAMNKIRQSVLNFTVDEDGRITNAKMLRTTTDPSLDKILQDAAVSMPLWTPAEQPKGVKVSEQFSIAFGNGC